MARFPRRKRLARPVSFEHVLDGRALASKDAPRREVVVPYSVWRQALGVQVAAHAEPLRIDGDTLWIRVASNIWANELALLEREIRAELARGGVHVRRLRFSTGPVHKPDAPIERRVERAVPALRPLPVDLNEALADVTHEALRESIQGAMQAHIALAEYIGRTAAKKKA